MRLKILAASATLAALAVASGAIAAPAARAAYPSTSPKQPIPYSQLDTYLKASPKLRAKTDWWDTNAASTGSAANTAAIVKATGGPSAGKLIDPLLTPKGVAPPASATKQKKPK